MIPHKLVGIFSTDAEVIKLGAEYLKVVSISYFFSAVVITMAQVQRSLERANLPFLVSVVSLGMNTILYRVQYKPMLNNLRHGSKQSIYLNI